MDNFKRFEVFDYYNDVIKDDLQSASNKYVEDLYSKCGYNSKTVNKLVPLLKQDDAFIQKTESKFYLKKNFKRNFSSVFWIIIFCLIGAAVCCFMVASNLQLYGIILSCVAEGIFLIWLISFILLSNKIKEKTAELEPVKARRATNFSLMCKENSKFTRLINTRSSFDIYQKIYPNIKLNSDFDDSDFSLYKSCLTTSKDEAIVGEIHGEVSSNPFIFSTIKNMKMVDVPYTGSTTKTITHTDSDGKTTTDIEVVTATIYKPKPFYNTISKMICKTNLMKDLNFECLPTLKNYHEVERFYKHHKNLRPMENKEFDRLFPFVRNNEISFRTVFSIYTQEQMVRAAQEFKITNLEMIKKDDNIQIDLKNDIQSKVLNLSGYKYLSYYDPEELKNAYLDDLNNYMKGLYQLFAPFISSNLYQQEKYVYHKLKTTKNSSLLFNTEYLANGFMNINRFLNPKTSNAVHDGIGKPSIHYSNSKHTVGVIDFASFRHTEEVEYVHKEGVDVPVHYLKFHPINQQHLFMFIKNTSASNQEYYLSNTDNADLAKNHILNIVKRLNYTLVIFDDSVKSIKNQEAKIVNVIKTLK